MGMMSVTSLNTKIKSLLEATFEHILVEGEVSSATYHTSGHLYFTIKDSQSSIKAVMFKSSVSKMKFQLKVGQHIVVEGSLGVYLPRGEYQFYAVNIEPYGQGALALAYEQLKEKLSQKGYFDAQNKKPIPREIKSLILVTAKESAALHDMLKICDKRWPLLEITIVDTLVQGEAAPIMIAQALKYADRLNGDVVVLARGGGSSEDLSAFNAEIVADAIFGMQTPIVSAIGHEIDVMISDFVADLRAPTPSAAMEMILPDKQEVLLGLAEEMARMKQVLNHTLSQAIHRFNQAKQIHQHQAPKKRLEYIYNDIMQTRQSFTRATRQHIKFCSNLPENETKKFQNAMLATIRHKVEIFKSLSKQYSMTNLATREGWAQISKDGKIVSLEAIKEGESFVLRDTSAVINAVCTSKENKHTRSL